jgi:hypothetical protein
MHGDEVEPDGKRRRSKARLTMQARIVSASLRHYRLRLGLRSPAMLGLGSRHSQSRAAVGVRAGVRLTFSSAGPLQLK